MDRDVAVKGNLSPPISHQHEHGDGRCSSVRNTQQPMHQDPSYHPIKGRPKPANSSNVVEPMAFNLGEEAIGGSFY